MNIDVAAGQSASGAALAGLRRGLGAGLGQQALAALEAQDFEGGLVLAWQAIERTPTDSQAWRMAAIAHEHLGRHAQALDAYQNAFQHSGQDAAMAGDIGRLALRMGLHEIAEKLLAIYLSARPDSLEGQINLAHALRGQHRYEEAVEILRAAVQTHPQDAELWTALGVVLVQQGDAETAAVFLNEALRLAPGSGRALYYRGNAVFDLGDPRAALDDYAAAIAGGQLSEGDQQRVRFAAALCHLSMGELDAGWEAYRSRLSPFAASPVAFEVDADPFDGPIADLAGRSLLLMAEQGLGDEVMFANTVPDLLAALGPSGRLALAVEQRLVPLFTRSFPAATVVAHHTEKTDNLAVRTAPGLDPAVDLWVPMAAPLQALRRTAAAFPKTSYLTADPARVAHWRSLLDTRPGFKAGLLWKSLKLYGERRRQFAPFELWAPVLAVPGVFFVNLQYGDCADELAHARDTLGVDIWQPPGIDLKQDLDDVAALTCALDLTIGLSNATLNLAGACGAPTWLIAPRGAWTMLGTNRYPWYPQARCFTAFPKRDGEGGWQAAMKDVAAALGATARRSSG